MQIKLPRYWSQITIGQFINIEQARKYSNDFIDQTIHIISILSGVPIEQVSMVNIVDVKEIHKSIGFIWKQEFPDYKPEREIEVNGTIYRSDLDIRKITAAQYIDLVEFVKDEKKIISNIHNIMACFYIPKGQKYYQTPHAEVADEFYNHMTIDKAYSTAVFFYLLYKNSMPVIKDCLLRRNKMMTKKAIEIAKLSPATSMSTGGGLQR
jgi:hypothetical protein